MRKWVKINLIVLGSVLLFIGAFNLFMDPFWCFEHKHRYNQFQKGMNERQQKANKIYFTSEKYNSLLLGSSRTTYMNQNDFQNLKVFNFSATGMRPQEYKTYIDFVINDTKQPIDTIILGTDFFGYLSYGAFMYDNAPLITNTTKLPYYRWKVLFSFDALNNSFKNFRDYLNPNNHTDRYNRDNVKNRVRFPINAGRNQQIQIDVKIYANEEYSSGPNPKFISLMSAIKEDYKDKKFIIYTTPISEPLFKELIKKGHYQDYENWLRTLVSIYGEVHHFMYLNSVSKNYLEYFADSNHAYVETNKLIAAEITNNPIEIPNDFGMLLTKENLEEKLKELRKINTMTGSSNAL